MCNKHPSSGPNSVWLLMRNKDLLCTMDDKKSRAGGEVGKEGGHNNSNHLPVLGPLAGQTRGKKLNSDGAQSAVAVEYDAIGQPFTSQTAGRTAGCLQS